jgi:N-methylhydantoinase A
LSRRHLSAAPVEGPLIIEEYEGTTVVPPDAWAWLDEHANIVIEPET